MSEPKDITFIKIWEWSCDRCYESGHWPSKAEAVAEARAHRREGCNPHEARMRRAHDVTGGPVSDGGEDRP